jgi:cation:H+ antiporter
MEVILQQTVQGLPLIVLLAFIAVMLLVLGKGADLLVEEAVQLSVRWGIPKFAIGATVVSLGTTAPEAAVSVLAALRGNPDLALGNAVGSIICNMGLIMGLGILIHPPLLQWNIVSRQGWLQIGSGVLLVVASTPWASPLAALSHGGRLPEGAGLVFLGLLASYLWFSVRLASEGAEVFPVENEKHRSELGLLVLGKLVGALCLVIGSSWLLIPGVQEAALRLNVPEGIIAATIVAFGTSLPELVTMVTASWRGHGELGVGNVIGANILNVLFVAGTSAAVTAGGLVAPAHFFRLLFLLMLFVLVVFQVGISVCGAHIKRPVGVTLLLAYLVTVILSYR